MADVKALKDRGLPLKIDGTTRYVKGSTKYTTCADVIKMVLKKTGIDKEYRHLFAIYEISRDGEKALSGKTRILKIAKAWTSDKNKFALRKTNPLDTASSSAQTEQDKLKETKKTDQKLFSKFTNVLKPKGASNKHKTVTEKHQQESAVGSSASDTASESDSSLDDFISGIDRSKMADFIKFFNVITTHGEKLQKKQKAMSASDESMEDEHELMSVSQIKTRSSSGRTLVACKRSSRRRSRARSKGRRRPQNDLHPLKMHSVQRLDYGFIDTINIQNTNADITQCDTTQDDIEACLEHPEGNFQRRTFAMKRYLRNGHTKSQNVATSRSETSTSALDAAAVQDMLTRSFSMTTAGATLEPKCHEIWNEDFRRENDSDPDSLTSDDSRDRDSVISYFERIALPETDTTPGSIDRANKLVDYSITDSELSDIETEGDALERNRNVMDIGYATTDASLSDNCCSSGQCEPMETSFSEYGFHVNQAFNSDSECDDALCSQTDAKDKNQQTDVANSSDYIRSLFTNTLAQTEDDEMDSFMKSKLFDDSLGEGFNLIQSDDENL